MISLLLKLFPARFAKEFGEDWVADTRQELQDARSRGAMFGLAWLFKTLGSALAGACISHSHEIGLAWSSAKATPYVLSSGSWVFQLNTKESPPLGFWGQASIAWLGAALAGHFFFSVFLPVWMHGVEFLWKPLQAESVALGFAILIGMMPFFAKVCGVGLGVYLALRFRVKSSIPGLTGLASLSLVVLCFLAFSSSHITWVLLDMGKKSQGLVQVFEEFPIVRENMGLPEEGVATSAQCEKATAVFSVASGGWSRLANASSDVVPFVLLKGLGRNLLYHGCWSDAKFLSAHHSWEKDASSILSDRRLDLHLPGLREGAEKSLSSLSLSRQEWCVLQAERDAFLGFGEVSPANCRVVSSPHLSVHSMTR